MVRVLNKIEQNYSPTIVLGHVYVCPVLGLSLLGSEEGCIGESFFFRKKPLSSRLKEGAKNQC